MRRGSSVSRLAVPVLAALFALPAAAYYPFVYYLGAGAAPAKFDLAALPNNTVRFFVSESGPSSFGPNDDFASVVSQIRQATQVWNSVSSSSLRVDFGGFEHAGTPQNTPAADVVFEDLAPGLLGFGGPTVVSTPVAPASGTPWVPITRSAVHININGITAPFPSYRESFFLVLVHEMGHALGLQHTFTSSAMSTATTSAVSHAQPIDDDDIAGISSLYPNAEFAKTGSITGRITADGNGLHLESVVAIRANAGAVSAFTNPDGTYRIDGVQPGQYYVYAHALPPDADIQGPWYPDGTVAAASGPTNTLFYPAATDLLSAQPVRVASGAVTSGIDIGLTKLPTLPVYDVSVYSYFNNNTVAVKPGYLNRMAGKATVVASGAGLGSNGQAPGLSAAFLGDSIAVADNGVRPYEASGYTYVALDLNFLPFGSKGPQHLLLNTAGFLHVLPSAVKMTDSDPPTIDSVTDNGDGTLTVTGTNWTSRSAIYFGSLQGTVSSIQVDNTAKGTAVVTPPAGQAGETVVLTVYDADGENSQFVQAGQPTYSYPDAPVPTIVSIEPASLPAGAEARVDITGTGFQFAAGRVSVGFGTSDVLVRKIFVLDANHLQADVSVAPGAALSDPDVSVFNGYRMVTATAGFHVTAPVTNLPAPIPTLFNALPGLNGAYAGAIVSIYGTNLAGADGTPSTVTFNGEAAQILYSSPTQINLQIPGDLAPGLCEMKVASSVATSFPLTVNIDTQPATIASIVDTTGAAISAATPAIPAGILTISLTGFAPDGTVISPDRVQVSVNGLQHPAFIVQQSAPGVYQVSLVLNADEPGGDAQSVIVYLDGRSSYPATISVAGSTAAAGLAAVVLRGGN